MKTIAIQVAMRKIAWAFMIQDAMDLQLFIHATKTIYIPIRYIILHIQMLQNCIPLANTRDVSSFSSQQNVYIPEYILLKHKFKIEQFSNSF